MKWRIYYAGGATFSDQDGSPFDAPTTGVLVIAKYDSSCGRVLVAAVDFYWWDIKHETWLGGDIAGLYQHLMCDRGPKAVLFGRYVTNEEYNSATSEALNDPDLPGKSARHSSESRLVLPAEWRP